MKIDHIAMYVNDLDAAKGFFTTYFGAQPGELYHNRKTGFRSYFLRFSDGARLEPPARTGYIHLALSVGSTEAVDALTARLRDDGYEVLSGPRTTGDGYYESCVLGIEGNQVEITV